MQVIVQFFKEMSAVKIAAMALAVVTGVILFIIYMSRIGGHDFGVLYSDLEVSESAKIAQALENRNIPYEILHEGAVIKVPKSEVINVRLSLAQEGLPTTGSMVGYEIFDKEDSIGATSFSQNIKLIRALEGELSRTISAFEQVDKARVHLVMPQREIFSKERVEPRASVVLKFRGSKRLGKSEIDAIGHLIVTSVPGLESKNVTIVDTKGRALKIGSAEDGEEFAAGNNEEARLSNEHRIQQSIESLLENTLGAGKIKAHVALEMNFDRTVTNSELYDPEGAVIRSVQSTDERDQTPVAGAGGDASVANNIPGGAGGDDPKSKFAITEKSDQTTNYEISKTVKNHISQTGIISKMSIGILLDGQYTLNPETKEQQYTPRSKEDIAKIVNLVKVAVGFNEDRGDKIEVINMQFSSELDASLENDPDWWKEELPNLIQTLVFAIVVLLILVMVIRPIALKAFEVRRMGEGFGDLSVEDLAGIGSDAASPMGAVGMIGPDGAVVASSAPAALQAAPSKIAEGPIQKINEIVQTSPQDLVNVLRKWMNERG